MRNPVLKIVLVALAAAALTVALAAWLAPGLVGGPPQGPLPVVAGALAMVAALAVRRIGR